MSPVDAAVIIGTVIAVPGVIAGWAKWALPRLRAHARDRRSMKDVLLGRPEGRANLVTGEPGQPRLPGIGERFSELMKVQEYQNARLHEQTRLLHTQGERLRTVEYEVKHNGGGSIKDAVKRIESKQAAFESQLSEVREAMKTQAEAQVAVWPAIEAVAKSTPPDERA